MSCPRLYLQSLHSTSTTMFALIISLNLTSIVPGRLSNPSVMLFLLFLSRLRICLTSLVRVRNCLISEHDSQRLMDVLLQRLRKFSFKSFLVLAPWQTPFHGLTVQASTLGMPSPSRASKMRRKALSYGRLEGRLCRLDLSP